MLDLKFIRSEPDRVRQGLSAKRDDTDVDKIMALDGRVRELLQSVEAKKAERNASSQEIARLKRDGGDASALLEDMKRLSDEIKDADAEVKTVESELLELMRWVPNLPHSSVPIGDETANEEVRRWREPIEHPFEVSPHHVIGEALGLLDLPAGSKMSGSGFVVFTGWGARLRGALIQFFLDFHRKHHGYTEVSTPFLVRRDSMFGTGQIPKLEDDMYVAERDDLFLIPTAEVSITNLYRESQLAADDLPIYVMGYSPCFRREAGTYGKETRGLVRVHQFDKVELVKLVEPEQSYAEHETLVNQAEAVLQALELPYRVLALASGDLSFAAAKCYDLEVWSPGEGGRWLEVSSCSNFEDFQARRMSLRYRNAAKKLVYPHTLNGSGLALPRVMVAILENFQTEQGTVRIPEVLRPYLDGIEELTPPPAGR